MMSDGFLPSAEDFPEASLERWRAVAEATLKGTSLDRLAAPTADGIRIEPIYARANAATAVDAAGPIGAAPFTRGVARDPASPWVIAQILDIADPTKANAQALTDLENGASGLVLKLGTPRGIRLDTVADVERLMTAIRPELIALTIEAGEAQRRVAALFAAFVARRGLDPAGLRFCPGLDAGGRFARLGYVMAPNVLAPRLADMVRAFTARGFRGPLLLADGRPWHEAGASEAQELGYALASAVEAMRLLDMAGLGPEATATLIAFKLALDADQFLSIAKLRACRLLWARATEAMGLPPHRAEIRVESARRMLTARDPWVNMLRTTMACLAGAVGGADEIALHPFTAALGLPDGFARRIARNTQLILAEEAGLGRVTDPAGGSFYVESLTQALAAKAWDVLQDVERAGGLMAALKGGLPQQAIAAVREKRAADIARRKIAITGVSEFPHVAEAPVAVLPVEEAHPRPQPSVGTWPEPGDGRWFEAQIRTLAGGASVEALGLTGAAIDIAPLPAIRLSEPFEALRDRADAMVARAGKRPAVFLAILGAPAETVARATFSKNLFEAGGFAVLSGDGFGEVATLPAHFARSGAEIACLCASDGQHASLGCEAAAALKAAGAMVVVLAGNPGERREALAGAGVDLFIHVGIDVVAALAELQRRIGI